MFNMKKKHLYYKKSTKLLITILTKVSFQRIKKPLINPSFT